MVDQSNPEDFGANSWLVEEMYERYRDEPETLSLAWRDFFSDYKPVGTPKVDPTGEIIRPSLDFILEDEFSPVATSVVATAVVASVQSVKPPQSGSEKPKATRTSAQAARLVAVAPIELTPLEVVEPEPSIKLKT